MMSGYHLYYLTYSSEITLWMGSINNPLRSWGE